ncbi:hypothetical protein Hanom_Chr00s057789g01783701 [Helianthus anomalus]
MWHTCRSDISWIGAYDRHSFGSLVSSDIILRGVLLSFFSIFRFRIGDNAKFKCGEGFILLEDKQGSSVGRFDIR